MTKTNFQITMSELAGAFERARRDSGETFTRLKNDEVRAPWVESAIFMRSVHDAVDGRMPDDWIYKQTAAVADAFVSYGSSDADTAQDSSPEIVDGLIDVYNSALAEWLAAHSGNADLCDEAVHEGLVDSDASLFDRIKMGQFIALQRIVGAVIAAVQEQAEQRDEVAA